MLAISQHVLAIDEDVHHAGRVLVRFDESRVVLNLLGIENNHVGEEAWLQLTTAIDSHRLRR